MLAKDLVLEDVVKIDVQKDILDALFTMFTAHQYILPVFSESKFVGILGMSHYARVLQDLQRKPESIHISEIMDSKITSVSPTADVKQVMDKLCERGVYGIPVTSGHDFLGIIRRQDLLKNFLHLIKGRFKVMDVMSYHITTSSIHDPIESVVKKAVVGGARRIVILNYDKVEGIITFKDLVNILLAEKVDLSQMSVKDILTPNQLTISKLDDAKKAGDMMLEWDVGGVPVVDKTLEGIVRDKDLIQRIRLLL